MCALKGWKHHGHWFWFQMYFHASSVSTILFKEWTTSNWQGKTFASGSTAPHRIVWLLGAKCILEYISEQKDLSFSSWGVSEKSSACDKSSLQRVARPTLIIALVADVLFDACILGMLGSCIAIFIMAALYEGLKVLREHLLRRSRVLVRYNSMPIPTSPDNGDAMITETHKTVGYVPQFCFIDSTQKRCCTQRQNCGKCQKTTHSLYSFSICSTISALLALVRQQNGESVFLRFKHDMPDNKVSVTKFPLVFTTLVPVCVSG